MEGGQKSKLTRTTEKGGWDLYFKKLKDMVQPFKKGFKDRRQRGKYLCKVGGGAAGERGAGGGVYRPKIREERAVGEWKTTGL